jgi:hypothetical protein
MLNIDRSHKTQMLRLPEVPKPPKARRDTKHRSNNDDVLNLRTLQQLSNNHTQPTTKRTAYRIYDNGDYNSNTVHSTLRNTTPHHSTPQHVTHVATTAATKTTRTT